MVHDMGSVHRGVQTCHRLNPEPKVTSERFARLTGSSPATVSVAATPLSDRTPSSDVTARHATWMRPKTAFHLK